MTTDKSYWTGYSGIELPSGYSLYINSGNESWALFKDGKWVIEDREKISPLTGELIHNDDGITESLIGSGVPWDITTELVSFYIEFLYQPSEE